MDIFNSFFRLGLLYSRAWRFISYVACSLCLDVAISTTFEVEAGETLTRTTDDFSGSGEINLADEDSNLVLNQDKEGTLNHKVSGAGSLAKYGSGNVTLAAENIYTGQTEINGGSLTGTTNSFGSDAGGIYFHRDQISGTDTDYDSADEVALIIDQDFNGDWNHATDTFGNQANTKIFKRGSGTVTITTKSYLDPSIATHTAGAINFFDTNSQNEWHVEEGILRAAGQYVLGFSGSLLPMGPTYFVGRSGTVDLNGFDQEFFELHNAGTVKFSPAGKIGATLTVRNYVGEGGTLEINTELGHEGSETDKLVVTGDVSGHTTMVVHNAGGLGDRTSGKGIEVVEVGGTSDDNAFSLNHGHVSAGAYEYRLYKGSLSSNSGDDQNWYLRSTIQKREPSGEVKTIIDYRKEVPLYAGLPAQMRQADLTMLGTLRKRIGETPSASECLGWGQTIAGNHKITQRGLARTSSKGTLAGLRLGKDVICRSDWRVGGYAGYLRGDFDVSGFASGEFGKVGDAKTNAYFLATYGTYTHANGAYLDLVLQAARHKAGIHPDDDSRSSQHGNGITFSTQAGIPVALGSSSWKVEPQVQLVSQYLDLSDADISGNTTVRQGHDNAFLVRLGADLKKDIRLRRGLLQPYGRLNLYHSPSGADRMTFATSSAAQTFSSGARYNSTELALGATLEISRNLKIHTELGRSWSHGGNAKVRADIQGSIGLSASF